MMDTESAASFILLLQAEGISLAVKRALVEKTGGFGKFGSASRLDLLGSGLVNGDVLDFLTSLRARDQARFMADAARKEGIGALGFMDDLYPPNLKKIPDPPLGLFYKGEMPDPYSFIAVVGSRKGTSYGRNVAYELSAGLGLDPLAVHFALGDRGRGRRSRGSPPATAATHGHLQNLNAAAAAGSGAAGNAGLGAAVRCGRWLGYRSTRAHPAQPGSGWRPRFPRAGQAGSANGNKPGG